jgi:hypothetical protein
MFRGFRFGKEGCAAARARYARGAHLVGVYRLRLGPPVGRLGDSVLATDGSLHPKGYTRHEVTRQAIVFVGWQVSDLVLSHVGTCDELVILWRS